MRRRLWILPRSLLLLRPETCKRVGIEGLIVGWGDGGRRNNKNSIVHFFHGDFRRCTILDTHLELLAPKHAEARFIRIDVDKAPFLVDRLAVRVLPCLMSFIDGKQVARIEGFERLGNTDSFRTVRLEELLVDEEARRREEKKDEDSGDDWD